MDELTNFLELPDVTDITEEIFVSKRIGKVTIKPMTSDEFSEYQKKSRIKTSKKGTPDFDVAKFNLLVVAGQTIKPDFTNAEFVHQAGCATPEELISKKLLSGEIATISQKVSELSGFDTDAEEDLAEAKN